MLTNMDNEALEAKSRADVLPDAADAGMDAAYKAGMWRHLQGGRQGTVSGGPSRKRC